MIIPFINHISSRVPTQSVLVALICWLKINVHFAKLKSQQKVKIILCLISFLSQSADQLKAKFQKNFIEISKFKNYLKIKSESKLNEYLKKINSGRNIIKNEINKHIEQIKTNREELLREFT